MVTSAVVSQAWEGSVESLDTLGMGWEQGKAFIRSHVGEPLLRLRLAVGLGFGTNEAA